MWKIQPQVAVYMSKASNIVRMEWKDDIPTNVQPVSSIERWQDINWKQVERRVFKLQKRIYQASSRGAVKVVRRLQKTLIRSWSAKVLATRRVTQDNQGKKTAGVDGVKCLSPEARLQLAGQLKPGTKAKPVRRVWIPKPGKEEKRPLGIPTIYSRALQALLKLALEPEWEAKFEPNSYGFRPGRSCHDAIEAIHNVIRLKPKYVLDADIAKCFDQIDQRKLIKKLNTFPVIARQIRAWLKSGVIDREGWFPTEEGVPQGGVISPLLANIALHGMEERIKRYARTLPGNKRGNQSALGLIRYADDFVVLHENLKVVQKCQKVLSKWLQDIGLELKTSKTRIAHTLEVYKEKPPGFNFLGFNVRQYRVGKYQGRRRADGKTLGFKTLIKPSKEKIVLHYRQIAEIVNSHNSAPQSALISRLNPVIYGWTNYYSSVASKATFSKMDCLTYKRLECWAKRRHPNKSKKWIAKKYWKSIKSRNWVFVAPEGVKLAQHSDKPIRRHIKVRGEVSPYNGDLIYWSNRMGRHPAMPLRVTRLLRMQEGRCPHCGHTFREEDLLEIDHIVPRSQGGRDEYKNWQLLHRHCHDRKTAEDAAANGASDKSHIAEEPCEVNVSRTVLKTSRGGDLSA